MSYIEVTGKTEEEAIRKALLQLSMDRDDVSVEILERAKSGFLGIGSSPARIRVTYGEEEAPEPQKEVVKEQPVQKAAPEKKREQPVQKPEKPESKPEKAEESTAEIREDANMQRIRTFLEGLLEHLDSPAQIKIAEGEKGRYMVTLEGNKLGALIGRRGETLDSIQQLTNYAMNSGRDKRIRVHLDAENYREKRERSLEALARKVADKVVRYRRSVTLEPMNAYERHVIHAALQEYGNVTTYSIGTEPNRRVVVAFNRESH